MPENSQDLTASRENNISGPDFFGLYKSEIEELLSQDDSLLPFPHQVSQLSGNLNEVGREKGSTKKGCQTKESNASTGSASLFSNGIGALLSDFKKERLNSLLRQSALTLPQEIDEMENPVFSVCRIRSCLRCKEKLLSSDALTRKADQPQRPEKKAKVIPASSDLESEHIQLDDDLRFILENDSTKVEELMESHTSEIFATLHHMETKLEELLNAVMTSCRAMTIPEKQQLCRLIQKLPARNRDRVVEIIEANNPSENYSQNELKTQLDRLDNVTLWRLHFYIEVVQAARG
ncbi:hypothetical protein C2S53_009506 [Perilla frutescens var. hirtella]|uniref:NET domain-containing protein n=1 Tax=Perilla frutescens var. hirtella TaxID=608512 RepID=A0AAD4JB15_PERFH|nr:hypothetical protein C2S53_009506 [Perilla frutescens var. hirtella]